MKVVALASVVACVSAFAPATRPSTSIKMNGVKENVAAAVLATVTIMSPVVANAGDIANGATIFAGNCAACHAGGNNVSGLLFVEKQCNTGLAAQVIQNEKTLRKEALDQYLDGGRKESSVVTQGESGSIRLGSRPSVLRSDQW